MNKARAIQIVKYLVVILIFYFIFSYLYKNFNALDFNKLHFNWLWLVVSVFIYFLHVFFNSVIWHFITLMNQASIPFNKAIKLRIIADFGKYIPGKVFTYGILIYKYEKNKVSGKKILICSILEIILSVLATIIVALICMLFTDLPILDPYKPAIIILAFACMILLYPPVMKFFFNLFFRIIKQSQIETKFKIRDNIILLLLNICNWLLFGWAFYFFVKSIWVVDINHYLFLTGAFAISSIAGLVAVFAPAGLGVREGVLVVAINLLAGNTIATVLSLMSRIWITISEIILLGLVYLYDFIRKKQTKAEKPQS